VSRRRDYCFFLYREEINIGNVCKSVAAKAAYAIASARSRARRPALIYRHRTP
jgi:hypothetical protein